MCVHVQAEGRHMLKQGRGRIINTASMASLLVPHPQKQIAYNASKAAVVKITQTLGAEWADRGLTVNCISPGIVNTALIQVRLCFLRHAPSRGLKSSTFHTPINKRHWHSGIRQAMLELS